jgi:hypothetical protein
MEITGTMMMAAIGFAVFHWTAKYLSVSPNKRTTTLSARKERDVVSFSICSIS